jgi:hypothetical protein
LIQFVPSNVKENGSLKVTCPLSNIQSPVLYIHHKSGSRMDFMLKTKAQIKRKIHDILEMTDSFISNFVDFWY